MHFPVKQIEMRGYSPTVLPRWVATVLFAIALSGCGGERSPSGDVTGTVTLNGQPLSAGEIIFFKEIGVPAAKAKLEPSGAFRLDTGIPVGDYRVAIQPPAEAPPTTESAANADATPAALPPKYLSETTSELTATVKEGANTFAFELK
ncbi:MAG: hypothetical protein GXY83_05605 [Rhodopirellula sp.]|nr:hypothetical protein [Rhodopirellula sp.]